MMLDTKSKYRLIGAGLLMVSAAVLLPLVLDGERPTSLDVQITVPEKPSFPEVVIAPVEPVDELTDDTEEFPDPNTIQLISEPEETPKVVQQAEPIPEVKQVAPVEKPATVKKEVAPIGERWTLQVATFGKKDNASRTLKRLQDAGYPAYVMTSNSLFKVFVGPELKREASEKMKSKVLKEFKLSGIVVKYSPNS